jgi:hypothetical protein
MSIEDAVTVMNKHLTLHQSIGVQSAGDDKSEHPTARAASQGWTPRSSVAKSS